MSKTVPLPLDVFFSKCVFRSRDQPVTVNVSCSEKLLIKLSSGIYGGLEKKELGPGETMRSPFS